MPDPPSMVPEDTADSITKPITCSRRRLLLTGGGAIATAGGLTTPGSAGTDDDTSGGDVRWTFETEHNGAGDSSPTVVDGTVYVGTLDDRLYALHAESGEKRWSFETPGRIESSPTVVDGTVYVGSQSEYLWAVDASDGSLRWRFESDRDNWFRSSPTVADGTVYVGGHGESVYAFDAGSGELRWRSPVGRSVVSSPTVVDDTVYVGCLDEHVYALDSESGTRRWKRKLHYRVQSSPTVDDGVVFVCAGDPGWVVSNGDSHRPPGSLWTLDAGTGERIWSGTGGPISSPTVADGTVYIGDNTGTVYARDVQDGSIVWEFDTNGRIWSSPTVADGRVFVGSSDERVYALDATTGRKQWASEIGTVSRSSPTVVDGTLFVQASGGLYALDAGVSGSSKGSRVRLGTLGHHHEWAENAQDDGFPALDALGPGFGVATVLGGLGAVSYLLARRLSRKRSA